jgi:hypothetical protein
VSTACLGNEVQQIDGKKWVFVLRRGSEQALYQRFLGQGKPLIIGVPLFDREFIERVTRGETRLLQLAIIVDLGVFAVCTLWLACPKSIPIFTIGNDESRESLI